MRKVHLLFAATAALYLVPANAKPVQGVAVDRFARKDNKYIQHLTIYFSEMNQIKASGQWDELGTWFYAFDHQVPGLSPFYRLQKDGDHFFTVDPKERINAINVYKYSDEGICCYISAGPIPGTIPLFRLRNGGIHLYTPVIPTNGLGSVDWKVEGIVGYVWQARDSNGQVSFTPPVLQEP